MNKAAIQRFAIWARTEMIAQVSQRAYQYGITAEGYGEENAVAVGGRVLSSDEQSKRRGLVAQIRQKGFSQVMEEVAYTWFNRFIALRFMEVNNYLPSHVRVFTDAEGAFKPEMLTEALHLELPGLDREKVAGFIDRNQTDDLYRYLLLTQCNALNESLPRMFERMGSYTELLLPNNILRPDGIIGRMIADIPEEDWTDQVQIIGWLYQYYNAELKDETFALLKKNVKITKERIPSATQLFTPDWIVRYMVENSLGRLWIEGHPDAELRAGWKYFLDEAEQETEVEEQLKAIRAEYSKLRPEDIKVIDPCMGSGHILVYAFDVLVQIYKQTGVSERDAAQSILQNNLYGLDIDDRAAQLAYFAVMMKARQYDRCILTRSIQPHLYSTACFEEGKEYGSLLITDDPGEVPEIGQITLDDDERRARHILAQQYDVVVTNPPYMGASNMNARLYKYIKDNFPDYKSDTFSAFVSRISMMLKPCGYAGFFTPYVWMFIQSYEKLRNLLSKQKTIETLIQFEYSAFEEATVPVCTFVFWNYHINKKGCYFRLVDFRGGMEVQRQKTLEAIKNHGCGFYYETSADNFSIIPGSPVAYWVSDKAISAYITGQLLGEIAKPKTGMRTGDNERFLRIWYEVQYPKIGIGCVSSTEAVQSSKKWFPYNKGGNFRLWYGNNSLLVNWENDGEEIKQNTRRVYPQLGDNLGWKITNEADYFRPGITWTALTSSRNSFRYSDAGFIFDSNKGPMLFCQDNLLFYLLGLLNSCVAVAYLKVLNPTLSLQNGDIENLPIRIESSKQAECVELCKSCISLARIDWDSFETSWDFQIHPMVPVYVDGPDYAYRVSDFYNAWKERCHDRFDKLKANEEELNRIFIDIYGLQDELTPEVEDRDVTVRLADLGRDVRSLISYAVGCMFGRYSLDKLGLVYAGGDWDSTYRVEKGHLVNEHGSAITFGGFKLSIAQPPQIDIDGTWKNTSFAPDADNIIPICDDEYFDDDIVGRFVQWLEIVYGKRSLEDNLKFIANALGGKGTPREVIRNYFLNDFYPDHLKIYQKRPIYWLFDSGKKNGFKALVYMHRYQSDLLARMRTDYVHEQQERYRTQLRHIEDAMADASTSERVKLSKQQAKLREQALELQKYEEKIHHLADQNIEIDLDDGIKHNYALFADVLAKIK